MLELVSECLLVLLNVVSRYKLLFLLHTHSFLSAWKELVEPPY